MPSVCTESATFGQSFLKIQYCMEPEVRKFLATILHTMSLGLVWLLINTVLGIKLGLLFWGDQGAVWHIVFYAWLIVSFLVLLRYIIKKWKEVPLFDVDQQG